MFVGYSGLNVSLLDGRLRNRFAFTYTNIDRDSYDPDATPVRTFDSRGKNERFEYQGILNITQGIEATFGAEREKSRLRTAAPSSFDPDPIPAHARATLESLYGQISVTPITGRSEEHTSELQSPMRISYAVFCLKTKKQ